MQFLFKQRMMQRSQKYLEQHKKQESIPDSFK